MDKNYVVAVDFGSSNMTMAVGRKDESTGLMKVEALVSRSSAGIEKGMIQNVKNVSEVLRGLKSDIEETLGIAIDEAYVGVSGEYIRYERYSDHVFVSDRKNNIVSEADVESLHNRMREVAVPEDDEVLDRFPLNYIVDYKRETETPVGAISRQLSSTFAFIISKRSPLARLTMVFEDSGLKIAGIFSNSAINADAVLGADERNDGAAVIDIGGNTTDVTVVWNNQVRYAVTIPLGGDAINADINKHGIPTRNVEFLKRNYGGAVAENIPETKGLKVKIAPNIVKTVMKRNLVSIIEARLTDIAEFVRDELKASDYDSKLAFGLVLTGGSASIPDIDLLFSRITGREVRVATASEGIDEASCKNIDSPELTSAVAILLAGARKGGCTVRTYEAGEKPEKPATDTKPAGAEAPAAPEKPVVPAAKPHEEEPKRTFDDERREAEEEARRREEEERRQADEERRRELQRRLEEQRREEEERRRREEEERRRREEENGGKRRDGFFGKMFRRLQDEFISGDEYEDTPLNDTTGYRQQAADSGNRRRITPKKEFDKDFIVDGDDREEL